MTAEDELTERRSNRLHPAVLEYRVSALEDGQRELKELVKDGFDNLANKGGKNLDRAILAVAAAASVASVWAAMHK